MDIDIWIYKIFLEIFNKVKDGQLETYRDVKLLPQMVMLNC